MKQLLYISFLAILFCSASILYAQSVQCSGTTQKGAQCKRKTTNSNGYCYQHQDQVARSTKDQSKTNDNARKSEPVKSKTKPSTEIKSSKYSSGTYNGHEIHTGPRGGKYYINSKGNKTYIKKK